MSDVWWSDVRIGDWVWIRGLWNRSERVANRVAVPTQVLGVARGGVSQTGVLLRVRVEGGWEREIDAGWFLRKRRS